MSRLTARVEIDGREVPRGTAEAYDAAGEVLRAARDLLTDLPLALFAERDVDLVGDTLRKIASSTSQLAGYCTDMRAGLVRYDADYDKAFDEARVRLDNARTELRRMKFDLKVTVEVERTEGKFASRDEIRDQIVEAIEGADPGSLDGENGGMYETITWEVSDA